MPFIPVVAIRQTTYLGHSVDVFDMPPNPCLLESSADQVLCYPLYHSAADRLPSIKAMAVVEAFCMSGEISFIRIRRHRSDIVVSQYSTMN